MTTRVALASLLAAVAPALAAGAEVRVTLDEAIRGALERNAELRAAAADVEGSRGRLDAARALLPANPSLEAAAGPRFRDRGDRSLDLDVSLSQPIEIGGGRGARLAAADAALAVARARLAARRAEVEAEVREAFGRAVAAGARVALASEAVSLSAQSQRAVRDRVELGKAARLDLNAATVDLARARREESRQRIEQRAALGALRTLLADPSVVPEGGLEALAKRGAPAGGAATEQHPDVVAAREALRSARAEREVAARAAVPALRVGGAFGREEGADTLQATLGVELPLFQRNQAERGAAAARVARAEVELAAAERRAGEARLLAGDRLEAARRALEAFTGEALAAAEENRALAAEGYDAGKLGFLETLLVRRDALETRRAYVDALEELISAQAEALRAGAALAQ